MVNYIETEEELADAQAGGKLVVVDFTASWCGPCRMIAPVFEQCAKDCPDVVFLKVDVDNSPELAQKYGVSAMPTFIFLKDGNKVDEFKGANEEKLKELLAKHK